MMHRVVRRFWPARRFVSYDVHAGQSDTVLSQDQHAASDTLDLLKCPIASHSSAHCLQGPLPPCLSDNTRPALHLFVDLRHHEILAPKQVQIKAIRSLTSLKFHF
jgi:hypothetical protein